MVSSRLLLAAGVCLGLGLAVSSRAHATITTEHLSQDAQVDSILPRASLAFVAEGRTGDRNSAAGFDLDLGPSIAAPAATAKYKWQTGRAEPFVIRYDRALNRVAFSLGGRTLEYSPDPSRPVTDIMIRTRAVTPGSAVTVGAFDIDGVPVDESCQSIASGSDNLWIRATDLSEGFVLKGIAVLSWGALVPSQSGLTFQVEAGQSISPATGNASAEATWGEVKALFR